MPGREIYPGSAIPTNVAVEALSRDLGLEPSEETRLLFNQLSQPGQTRISVAESQPVQERSDKAELSEGSKPVQITLNRPMPSSPKNSL